MNPWMWTGIWWLCLLGGGFWLGILYKGRKFRPVSEVLKRDDLKTEDKIKQIAKIVT